jgi:alpha-galactosidase
VTATGHNLSGEIRHTSPAFRFVRQIEPGPAQTLSPFRHRLLAILAAPLIAGNDLRSMRPEIHDILTNKEVIAVNQDPLGSQGKRVRKDGDLEVWAKQLSDGSRAVILFNRGPSEQNMMVTWKEAGYTDHLSAAVRDLWQHKDLPETTGKFGVTVLSHGVVMVTIKP